MTIYNRILNEYRCFLEATNKTPAFLYVGYSEATDLQRWFVDRVKNGEMPYDAKLPSETLNLEPKIMGMQIIPVNKGSHLNVSF